MLHDSLAAEVIQERLDICHLLDDSVELSFMERASFREDLLRILDDFDHARQSTDYVLQRLAVLRRRVLDVLDSREKISAEPSSARVRVLRH